MPHKEEPKLANQTELNREMTGYLPQNAPLANPYVPFQDDNPKQYTAKKGLIRGTLFPGLDLPFMGLVNTKEKSDTPLHELMALNFAITELTLYLDTHPNDREVAELLRSYIELYLSGKERYEQKCGPLTHLDAVMNGEFRWLSGPWPWEYRENGEG